MVKNNFAPNSDGMQLKMAKQMPMDQLAILGILMSVQVQNHLHRKTGIMRKIGNSVTMFSIGVLTIEIS